MMNTALQGLLPDLELSANNPMISMFPKSRWMKATPKLIALAQGWENENAQRMLIIRNELG
jgi:hypothetical protein